MAEQTRNIAERVGQSGQTHSMELIFFPVLFLLIIGVIANNLASSNIQTTPQLPTPFCTGYSEPASCYATNQNGCDVNMIAYCQLGVGTTFNFLNPNSPFTTLLQGNIVGFFIGVFTTGEEGNAIYSGYTTCIPLVNGVYTNRSGTDLNNVECLGYTAAGVGNHPFPNVGEPMNASSVQGNTSVWEATGCRLVAGNYPCILNSTEPSDGFQAWNGTNAVQGFNAILVKNSTSLTKTSGCTIYFSVSACFVLFPYLFHISTSFTCPNTNHVNGIHINATTYYCLLPYSNPNSSSTATNQPQLPNSFAGVSFIFGVILLFLGLGLALTTALVGFTISDQGSKLAQVFGIGIVVWSFIYGEFGSWLTNLPFNLGTIALVILSMMFFLGLYWRLFTLD